MKRSNPEPITIEEAQNILRSKVPAPTVESVPLVEALGAVLAEDVESDMYMPPFDRVMMDGFAVIAAETPGELEIIEDIPAGHVGRKVIRRGQCARVMTGAPLPKGADAVQQVEKTKTHKTRVEILKGVKPGQNIAARGHEIHKGERVLEVGQYIRPAEVAVLAAVGKSDVTVYRRPKCCMVATGDELVDPSVVPGPGQIRNSNGFSVPAQIRQLGLECRTLARLKDDESQINVTVQAALHEFDVLVLSGGVSAGDWDLVIPALEKAGVKHRLHQVLIKPGRPFFFGTKDDKVVFGLPGNPVSSFVTFEVFVRPFLGRMMGHHSLERRRVRAKLTEPLKQDIERVNYLPAIVKPKGDGFRIEPLPWKGPADIFTLSRANALAIQPIHAPMDAGELVDALLLD